MAAFCRKLAMRTFRTAVLLSLVSAAVPAFADTPYVGEIRVFGFSFCPNGWLPTQGQVLSIQQNVALFSLMGTTYGGNGVQTFQLIDTQGRSMMNQGTGSGLSPRQMGDIGGQLAVSLTTNNLPPHTHLVNANNLDGDKPGPGGKLLAAAPPSGTGSETIYSDQPASVAMSAAMISPAGAGQPISVTDPSLAITTCIATQGIFPSRP
ncbi:tail fiber protein [Pseudotabrizicola sp. 4114]|uniref:phage tail protein n=1 Tax=Pseudotabrizicola sp. 4114 TaxID=2817731 RepID=UPI00285DF9A3|nr:microcystin-dependent protein [Pseudorhodobacter sp. 4114]